MVMNSAISNKNLQTMNHPIERGETAPVNSSIMALFLLLCSGLGGCP